MLAMTIPTLETEITMHLKPAQTDPIAAMRRRAAILAIDMTIDKLTPQNISDHDAFSSINTQAKLSYRIDELGLPAFNKDGELALYQDNDDWLIWNNDMTIYYRISYVENRWQIVKN